LECTKEELRPNGGSAKSILRVTSQKHLTAVW
jgi:hypothetical protein